MASCIANSAARAGLVSRLIILSMRPALAPTPRPSREKPATPFEPAGNRVSQNVPGDRPKHDADIIARPVRCFELGVSSQSLRILAMKEEKNSFAAFEVPS